MDTLTVLSWNLLGSEGVDVDLVTAVLERAAPDVVALQEVQRRQCRTIADRLGWSSRWAFKHWPIRARPEGLAVLTPHRLGQVTPFVLQHAARWSWRRRIAIDATVVRDERPWRLMNVHLSPHDADERRDRETDRILERSTMVAPIVAGDLNDRPGGPAAARFQAAGWRDAWAEVHRDAVDTGDVDAGATNWTAGARAGRPPTQRLDVVFVPPGQRVEAAAVIDQPGARLAEMSDHLPLTVTVGRGGS